MSAVLDGIDLSGKVTKTSTWQIGMGAFTDVYQGELTIAGQGEVKSVAIKVFRGAHIRGGKKHRENAEASERRLKREAKLWSMLDHPNVHKYLGYCNSRDVAPSIAMISPFCKNGTVTAYIEGKPRVNRLRLIRQVMDGLCYLHNYRQVILHGDLHCNNILIDDNGNAMLSDFGRAQVVDDELYITNLLAGCAEFMAPELFPTLADQVVFTTMSDIYAFAMIVYEIYTGATPFSSYYDHKCSGPSQASLWLPGWLKEEKRPKRSADRESRITNSLWELMETCWATDANSRPSAQEVVTMLQRV